MFVFVMTVVTKVSILFIIITWHMRALIELDLHSANKEILEVNLMQLYKIDRCSVA
jgi:hypothetical protein